MVDKAKVKEARKVGCKGCLFYAPKPPQAWQGTPSGECRVAPPRTSNGVRFPVMFEHDWCASFEALDDGQPEEVKDFIPGSAPVIS